MLQKLMGSACALASAKRMCIQRVPSAAVHVEMQSSCHRQAHTSLNAHSSACLQPCRFPVQCPVGSSTFRFGYQGGNPWYRKMMVANARVPVRNVQISIGGSWSPLTKTIDNYWWVPAGMWSHGLLAMTAAEFLWSRNLH